MRKDPTGIMYIVSGRRDLLEECLFSVSTARKYNPGIKVQLVTDNKIEIRDKRAFDYIDYFDAPLHPLKAKVKFLCHSRFGRTLFLDADTEIRSDITHLFKLLEDYGFCFTLDNLCDWSVTPYKFLAQESKDINTGFLLFDDSPAIARLFDEWLQLILPQDEEDMRPGHNCDQVYFNRHLREKLLQDPSVNWHKLSNSIYNVRPWCWESLKQQGIFEQSKILHAHHLNRGFFAKLKRTIGRLTK